MIEIRGILRKFIIYAAAFTIIYFFGFVVMYCLYGEWGLNKYEKFYFDNNKAYLCTKYRYSKLIDVAPKLVENIEIFYLPILTTIEIHTAIPIPAECNEKFERLKNIINYQVGALSEVLIFIRIVLA